MKEFTLFEKCRGCGVWFSINPVCDDWEEIIDEIPCTVPEGFDFGRSITGAPGIWRKGDHYPMSIEQDKRGVYMYGGDPLRDDYWNRYYLYIFRG